VNPSAYAAALDEAALAHRPDRRVLVMEGRDPAAMLQGLASNDVTRVAGGACVYAVMLTPKGRMIADLRALPGPGGALLVDVPAAAIDAVGAHLTRFVPPRMAKARPSDERILGLYGPAAAERLAPHAGGAAPDPTPDALTRGPGGLLFVGTRYAGVPGVDVVGAPGALEGIATDLEAAGVPLLDPDTLEVLRVEAGSPRWGAELDEERIPLEAGLADRAISQTKGCYTGQEVIVRILHRGHVNWHLRGLTMGRSGPRPHRPAADGDGDGRLAPGAELTVPGETKVVARVTSAVDSPRLGPIALGYVRREVAPGSRLALPGADPDAGATDTARVVELPFEGA